MKIVKHGHACLELIKDGQRLLIDPGSYSEPMGEADGVIGVVITHKHDDHCFEEQLDAIIAKNPGVTIYGTDEVRERLGDRNTVAVHHGDFYEVGPFTVEFFGDLHAEIHRSIPIIQNCGVMVDDALYYPGDSFTQPDRPVKMLACPTSAPWLKMSDVMDFVDAVKPKKSFATHNIHLSELGHQMNNGRVKAVTEQHGGRFTFLQVGDSIELD
jgi:L-ascorbate metabolism protein UlaG (beta-lactamase superfamily)